MSMSDLNELTSDMPETHEIEDVSFLPGGSSAGKRSVYEPNSLQRCRQMVCTQTRAIVIATAIVITALIFALIAAFARPAASPDCSVLTTPRPPGELTTTLPVSTNGEAFPWTDIRLPDTIRPEYYTIDLNVDLEHFEYAGNVSIFITAVKDSDFVVFHSKNLTIKSYSLHETNANGGSSNAIPIDKLLETIPHEQIYLKLSRKLSAGKKYRLGIQFDAVISPGLTGFYRSSYDHPDGTKHWLATTHFEPTDARKAFPCFDEPQMKANFTISLIHSSNLISLSNMALESKKEYSDELVAYHFAPSVRMSTYLVAFVVCDFKRVKSLTETNNIEVSIYAPPPMINQTQLALDVAVSVLEFYENDFFQIQYPLSKSDNIAIPDFPAGAMENWGLITYLLRSLLYSPGESSAWDRQWVATVVAHELAHQWFGNLVTMEWWNDLWLNEGFANFMEYKGVNHAKPEWKMLDQFLDDALVVGMYSDGLKSSHPINVPVYDPAEIGEIFDAISYQKGGSIIRMLEAFLGDEKFLGGLRNYLSIHSYKNAATEDLWSALTKQTENDGLAVDVGEVMDTWTSQMGYPVVNVQRSGQKVKASQERFLFNPRSEIIEEYESPHNYKWHIPLTYISSDDGTNAQVWMPKDSVSFSLKSNPQWIKMNVGMTGFYRVNYDSKDWGALIEQLNSNHLVFSAADRTSLIEDIFSLSRSGHVNISQAMDLSKYLINEKEYIPWKIGVDGLSYIGHLLEDAPEYELYKKYMTRLISERLAETEWIEEGTQLEIFQRSLILGQALHLGVPSAVEKVQESYQRWRNGEKVAADLKGLVYHGGIKYGTESDWNFMWEKFSNTTLATEKSKLLSALSASNNALILKRYLQLALDESKIRQSECASVILSVGRNSAGRVLSWKFVRENWDLLKSKFFGLITKMKRIITGTAGQFTTQLDYDEVKAFLEKKLSGIHMRAVPQTLEQIEMNIDWLTRNRQTVVAWLKKETGSY